MARITTLKNGLSIITDYMDEVFSSSLYILINVGSNNEEVELGGISHFIEHMMFKGTSQYTAKDISEKLEGLGAMVNAYTGKEYTVYHAHVLPEALLEVIEIYSKMQFDSQFSSNEMERERMVIKEEYQEYEDDPSSKAWENLEAISYGNTSAGRSIIGTIDSINGINQDKIKKFIEQNYKPENYVICVTGKFDEEKAIRKIVECFGNGEHDFKTSDLHYSMQKSNIMQHRFVSPQFKGGFISAKKDVEQVHLCLSMPASSLYDENNLKQKAMSIILGEGMSSRLFYSIREQLGLVYSIHSTLCSHNFYGMLVIKAITNPKNLNLVLEKTMEQISQLSSYVSDDEVEKAKRILLSVILMRMESSSNRSSRTVHEYGAFRTIKGVENIRKEILNITVDDIKSEMKGILDKVKTQSLCGISLSGKVDGITLSVDEVIKNLASYK